MSNDLPVAPFIIDEASFIVLYNRYWYESLELARQLLQDDFVAEDLVQNIFISLWKRKDTLKIDQPVGHYLKRAVKFAVATYVRDKTRQDNAYVTAALEELNTLADAPLLHRELQDKLDAFIKQLPHQNQQIYHMRFHQSLNNPQIADILGISEKTVRNQFSLVLKRVRSYLSKEGY